MPIVSSKYKVLANKAGGARMCLFTFTDHLGEDHYSRVMVGKNDDIQTYLNSQVSVMNERVNVWEKRKLERDIEKDDFDPTGYTRRHITAKEQLVAILKAFMKMPPDKALMVAKYLHAQGITPAQIEAATSTAIKDKVVARVQALRANATMLEEDKDNIVSEKELKDYG